MTGRRSRFAAAALSGLIAAWAWGAELHVAPNGADSGAGTAEAPLATLTAARDRIRSLRRAGPLPGPEVTVWVHGGTYGLSESFVLGEADGGTAEQPVVYRAVDGEAARLVGGRELPVEAFAAVTDEAVLRRMEEGSRASVVVADLRAQGIADLGTYPDQFREPPVLPELYFNDTRMTLARWPNEGWAEIAKIVASGPAPWRNFESDALGTFEYSDDRPARWTQAPAVWLQGYWCFDWADETIRVQSIDPASKQITLARQHVYGLGSGNPAPRRFRALNLLEELDAPGEYFIDREHGLVYFWPPAGLAEARVVLGTLAAPAISVENASFVTLRGLRVETCAGDGIAVTGGKSVTVAACRVRNTGRDGIVVEGGEGHRIVACDVFDIGTNGIRIAGGDRKTLQPSRHEVVNNHLHHVSQRQRTAAYHVTLSGVGIRLAHNHIHHSPHQSILLHGNDHVIEFNDVHDVGMDSDDCGAFYMGRNPSERGNVIRYNYWHDIGSTMAHGSCAVYFDDGTGGQTVFGNVFYRAAGGSFGAVFLHGGHDNVVENNIFVECKRAIGHAPWDDALWKKWLGEPLWQGNLLKEVDITQPPYTDRYPELKDYMTSDTRPRLNRARRNLVVRCKELSSGNWDLGDTVTTNADPGFVDAAGGDFRLREDALAYSRIPGFETIPFDRIGMYTDEYRPEIAPESGAK